MINKELKDYLTQYKCKVVKTFKKVIHIKQPKETFIVFNETTFNTDYVISLKDLIRCKKNNNRLPKILTYCEIYKGILVYCNYENY